MKIDYFFTEAIEALAVAAFASGTNKLPYVNKAIAKLDALKVFLQIVWEIKSLDNKKYITLSLPLNEIGCQLGGWHNQILKQNSPAKTGEK